MTIIKCKNCGMQYDVDDLEETNCLENAVAIMCENCGEHLADVENEHIVRE